MTWRTNKVMRLFSLQGSFDESVRWLLVLGAVLLSITNATALSAPPTVSDRALGQSLRTELGQVRNSYIEGRISRPVANRRTATSFAKALSPGGLRFQREFPQGVHLDFMREDISKIVNNALSGNRTNWHGYYRELKYINAVVAPGSPFELNKANSRPRSENGRIVEFDSLFDHKRSRGTLIIEIKDKRINAGNLQDTKDQIARIANCAREKGVTRTIWVNRQRVPEPFRDELMKFGELHNFGIYDNVTTGQTAVRRGQAQHFDDVLRTESKLIARSCAQRVTKVMPYVGVAVESGFAIHKTWQWHSGRATTRDLVVTGGGAAGGIAGATGGALAGAAIGSLFPGAGTLIGGVVGGAVGGIGGHIAGNQTTEYAIDKFYYEKQTEKEREATLETLVAHYGTITAK